MSQAAPGPGADHDVERVGLPGRVSAPLVLLMLAGMALLGSGLAPQLGDLRLVLGGLGLAVLGFAVAILINREPAATLLIHHSAGHLVVEGGGRAQIPAASLEQVGCTPDPVASHRHAVWLVGEGSLIQLARLPTEAAAEELASRLSHWLDGADREPTPHAPQAAPAERFAATSRVSLCRELDSAAPSDRASAPSRLVLRWAARGSSGIGWPLAVAVAGLGAVAWGLYAIGAGLAAALATAVLPLLMTIVLALRLRELGAVQQLTLDSGTLALERLRRGRPNERRALATADVVSVDYAYGLDSFQPVLSIRTTESADATAGTPGEQPGAPTDLPARVRQLWRSANPVLVGELSLPERINLVLTLRSELARRRPGQESLHSAAADASCAVTRECKRGGDEALVATKPESSK